MTRITPTDRKNLRAIADILYTSEKFLLTCHAKVDGDAIGSVLGLGLALRDAGRDVTLYTEDPVPANLRFLPGTGTVQHEVPDPLPEKTTLVVLDCNKPHRIGREADRLVKQASTIVVLDHHPSASPFLEEEEAAPTRCFSYIQPDIFAAGAIVLWLLEELGWPVTKDIATNLYTAVLTDTGCFRHSNTNETAFQMAGLLAAAGASPYDIATEVYQKFPQRKMQLLTLVLKTLEVKEKGKVALLQATPEMFRISGAIEEDTEDFVGYARCIDTVEVAVFIREVHPGQVSVSLRSKSFFDVAELARRFGGGGHVHAAGFRKTGTAPEIREELLNRLIDDLKNTEQNDA